MTIPAIKENGLIPVEHERRWFPDLGKLPFVFSKYPMEFITQGYLEDEHGTRLRDTRNGCVHTYLQTRKSGSGVSRSEDEYEIRPDQFDSLWSMVKCSLVKDRYFVECDGINLQLNIYHGPLENYLQIEVEFDTADEANAFVAPQWFGPEVTHDERHGNYSLAKFGAPL